MKAKVYDDFIINVTNNGTVHIVSETGVATLPINVVRLMADYSGIIDEIKKDFNQDLESAKTEVQRQRGVIKDLEGDLARANCDKVELTNRIVELENSIKDTMVDTKSIVESVVCKAVGHKIVDIDGEFIADCGTSARARNVAKALYEGKVMLSQVKLLFNDKVVSKGDDGDIDDGGC